MSARRPPSRRAGSRPFTNSLRCLSTTPLLISLRPSVSLPSFLCPSLRCLGRWRPRRCARRPRCGEGDACRRACACVLARIPAYSRSRWDTPPPRRSALEATWHNGANGAPPVCEPRARASPQPSAVRCAAARRHARRLSREGGQAACPRCAARPTYRGVRCNEARWGFGDRAHHAIRGNAARPGRPFCCAVGAPSTAGARSEGRLRFLGPRGRPLEGVVQRGGPNKQPR
eukprot:356524-Chlamydomonas_euryale.AAC.5